MSLHPFHGERLLEAFERAEVQPEVLRPLALLAAATPSLDWTTLAHLPLGERNAQLLRLRGLSFGPRMDLLAGCRQCSEQMEFSLEVGSLLAAMEEPRLPQDAVVSIRPLNTLDLAASLQCEDLDAARRTLLVRGMNDGPAAWAVADESQRQAILLEFEHVNAAAEMRCDVACPACGTTVGIDVDIAAILWREVRVAAKRLLREVGQLAEKFGWTEPEVLALSPRRRAAYLEMTA